MRNKITSKVVFRYINIMFGCLLLGVAFNVFLQPNNFVLGGVTGFGLILDTLCQSHFGFSFPVWLSNIMINAPLFLIGYKLYGFHFVGDTIFATLFLSFSIGITEWLPPFTKDILLASVFGALIDGLGLGLIIKNRCTTGGTDLMATIIHRFLRHVEISKILLFIDFSIITLGVVVFGIIPTMYAIISISIFTKVIGTVVAGFDFSKSVFIISNKTDEIGHAILNTISRGATSLDAHGMYTKQPKNVIFCVVSQKQIPELKELVDEIDPDAFVVVSNASEVIGHGFTIYKK